MMEALALICAAMATYWAVRWVVAVLGWAASRGAWLALALVKVVRRLRPRAAALARPAPGGNVIAFRRSF